jgi:hypothetical protein
MRKLGWRSVVGGATELWAIIDAVLHWGEHWDFLQLHQAAATSMLVNHPMWVPIFISLLGLGLIVWDIRRHQSKAVAHETTNPPIKGGYAESVPAITDASPDFKPIHLAVEWIAKHIGDSDESGCYPRTLSAIRQNAVSGELKVRGRKQIDKNDAQMHFSGVVTDVPKEYWDNSVLTALTTTADPDGQAGSHTNPETAKSWPGGYFEKRRWSALHVDWNDVLRIWPNAKSSGLIRLDEVLRLVVGHVNGFSDVPRALNRFRELGLLGKLEIFGGINWSPTAPMYYDDLVRDRIPATFWKDHRIIPTGVLGDTDPRGATARLDRDWAWPEDYYGIWFDADAIKTL